MGELWWGDGGYIVLGGGMGVGRCAFWVVGICVF